MSMTDIEVFIFMFACFILGAFVYDYIKWNYIMPKRLRSDYKSKLHYPDADDEENDPEEDDWDEDDWTEEDWEKDESESSSESKPKEDAE